MVASSSDYPTDSNTLVITTHRDDFVQGKLGESISAMLGDSVDVAQFDEIEFLITKKVELFWKGKELGEYKKIIFYGGVSRLLRITHPLAKALLHRNISCYTSGAETYRGVDKLSQNVYFSNLGIKIPKTYFAAPNNIIENSADHIGFPLILKDILSSMGKRNFLINSQSELEERIADIKQDRYLVQEYIENDGDIRILINNRSDSFAFRRSATSGSHLNNTSAGATVEKIEDIHQELINQCGEVLQEFGLPLSGIDVIDHHGEYYFLEANTQPQIFTGVFADEKSRILKRALLTD